MDKADVIRISMEVGLINEAGDSYISIEDMQRFAILVAAVEHTAVLQAIEAVYTLEEDRNPMFSDGYKYALDQIETLIRARGQ